jgi:hypothetical protein
MDLSARSSALTFFFFLSHQLIPRTNLKAYSLLSQQPASQPASRGTGALYIFITQEGGGGGGGGTKKKVEREIRRVIVPAGRAQASLLENVILSDF